MFRNNLWNAASMNKNYQHKTSFSEMFSPLSSSSLSGSQFDQVFQLDGSMLTAKVNDNSNNSTIEFSGSFEIWQASRQVLKWVALSKKIVWKYQFDLCCLQVPSDDPCMTCRCPPNGGRVECSPVACPLVECVDPEPIKGECCGTCRWGG